jgi:glycolate oxidase
MASSSPAPRLPRRGAAARVLLLGRLRAVYGDRVTADAFERSFYRRDVAPLPALVDRVLQTEPEVVARPVSADEVAQTLRMAAREGVPVVPRAGATTAHFGCVPVAGGVVLDLMGLWDPFVVDPEAMTVMVGAGTVWADLDRRLGTQGLAVKSMPSSAAASTVGGWVCTMGYGIGSLRYGRLGTQMRSLEVALVDGTVRRLDRGTKPPAAWFASSEGTLGVVTAVELEVRPLRPIAHVLVTCSTLDCSQTLVERVLAGGVTPYAMHLDDPGMTAAMGELGYAPEGTAGRYALRVDIEADEGELAQATTEIRAIVATVPGAELLPTEAADHEWRERFRLLRVKRGGPSVVGAEVLLPVGELAAYLGDVERLGRTVGVRFISYAHVVGDGLVVVMTMTYTDETQTVAFILSLGVVRLLHDLSAKRGGRPYGVGVWGAPHVRAHLAEPPLDEQLRRKRALDSLGIMNPGKGIDRLRLLHPAVLRAGMGGLAAVDALARKLRPR